MLVDASHDIVRDAEIERAMLFAGKQIDIASHRDRWGYEFRARSQKARAPE
jgi:hypothetical protein